MKKFLIVKAILISTCLILIFSVKSLATEEGTLRMQIVESNNYWTGITVSESYKACEELNNSSSTLGSSNVEAHLSTDYDWSAMAIFSASQYGDVGTNNNPTITTGNTNKSGIYNIGGINQWITTGILENASYNTSRESFFEEDHKTIKQNRYIKIWKADDLIEDSPFVGFNSVTGTAGWWASGRNMSPESLGGWSFSAKKGLFGVGIGRHPMYGPSIDGNAYNSQSFRPVIWN